MIVGVGVAVVAWLLIRINRVSPTDTSNYQKATLNPTAAKPTPPVAGRPTAKPAAKKAPAKKAPAKKAAGRK